MAAGHVHVPCPLVLPLLYLEVALTSVGGFAWRVGWLITKYFDDSESKNTNFANLDMIIGGN